MTRKSRSSRSGAERTQRQLRVGEMLRHALVDIFARGDLRDPDLEGVSLTVAEVRVSPDMRNATAFVLPLGGERSAEITAALNRAAPYLRRELGKTVTLRYLPRLSFNADDAFDEGQRIEALLRSDSVARDLGPAEEPEE